MKKSFILVLVASLLTSMSLAAAEQKEDNTTKAPVTITTASYQSTIYRDKNGTEQIKWNKAVLVTPGDVVKYVDIVSNNTLVSASLCPQASGRKSEHGCDQKQLTHSFPRLPVFRAIQSDTIGGYSRCSDASPEVHKGTPIGVNR
jgi:hypothetical protein